MSYKVYHVSMDNGTSVVIWNHMGHLWKGNLHGGERGFWIQNGSTLTLSVLIATTNLSFFTFGKTAVGDTGTGEWVTETGSGYFTWNVTAVDDSADRVAPPSEWPYPVGK